MECKENMPSAVSKRGSEFVIPQTTELTMFKAEDSRPISPEKEPFEKEKALKQVLADLKFRHQQQIDESYKPNPQIQGKQMATMNRT